MAVSAYLELEGQKGPSTQKDGAIDCLSFSFGASMVTTYGTGSSGQESKSGRADTQNVSLMKVTDKTTPFLFEACVSAKIYKKATLTYTKTVAKKQEPYFKIEMTDAMMTSYQVSGSSENPVESISFAFQKVKVSYAAEKDDGTLDAFVDKGFDVAKAVAF